MVYGFVPDLGEKVYGLFTDLYRIWGGRLSYILRICTGFGGTAYGYFTDLNIYVYISRLNDIS